MDPGGERRISQQVVAAMRGVFAAVLEVHGEGHRALELEAAGDGGLLVACLLVGGQVGVGVVKPGRIEERLEQGIEIAAAAQSAAVLLQAIESDGPALRGLEAEVQAGEARTARTTSPRIAMPRTLKSACPTWLPSIAG